ncbi:unnamed protein product [Rhizophagus irregularis]|nr:unnamed protein product [Rhizophagus irregularis]
MYFKFYKRKKKITCVPQAPQVNFRHWLSGLSKKATDCAIKSNMQHELVNLLKAFIYNVYNKNVQETQETQETETFTDINNPTITKHKRRLPKRLKSSIETSEKRVLKDSTNVNITENETRGRKCGKCK